MQLRFSSNNIPKNFIVGSRLIVILLIFNSGRRNGILSWYAEEWKKLYLAFDIFNDNLLILNHS